ncbi:OmpA-like transmembrane domain-containing protein [Brucella ceti TE28753-12]|nr:OmpA-like transmembrane domain-containing protein [Brucella ceti TE28753-12]
MKDFSSFAALLAMVSASPVCCPFNIGCESRRCDNATSHFCHLLDRLSPHNGAFRAAITLDMSPLSARHGRFTPDAARPIRDRAKRNLCKENAMRTLKSLVIVSAALLPFSATAFAADAIQEQPPVPAPVEVAPQYSWLVAIPVFTLATAGTRPRPAPLAASSLTIGRLAPLLAGTSSRTRSYTVLKVMQVIPGPRSPRTAWKSSRALKVRCVPASATT